MTETNAKYLQPDADSHKDYPLVSVIMNCYNGEKYLKEAIDSVYAQTYPNWEIIFVDNASVDQTAAIANSYDNRLKYFRNPLTVKLGESRNIACEHAKGEFLAFLDCDDIWMPDKLELQIPLFLENQSV
ncbi:glycosyltransferase family 2 protein, partial [Phormidium sp. CCY1219]|uniref:glycosyltransferase family 2 protein n=1 Tax=Phormidium sp. CCY1219 TaxID=2886104 RepID=UPI002D1F2F85